MLDKSIVLAQIDAVLAKFEEAQQKYQQRSDDRLIAGGFPQTYIAAPEVETASLLALLDATIRRFAPDAEYGRIAMDGRNGASERMRAMAGILRALRSDYDAGRLQSVEELVHANMFSDFLEMAEYLLREGNYREAAAVLAGGVLEQHIRQLSDKHGTGTTFTDRAGNIKPKSVDTMNNDLQKAGVFDKNIWKQVTAWYGIRNSAAHAKHTEYDQKQVEQMVEGLRNFLTRCPA